MRVVGLQNSRRKRHLKNWRIVAQIVVHGCEAACLGRLVGSVCSSRARMHAPARLQMSAGRSDTYIAQARNGQRALVTTASSKLLPLLHGSANSAQCASFRVSMRLQLQKLQRRRLQRTQTQALNSRSTYTSQK